MQTGIQTTCLKDSQLCLRALTQNEWALDEGKRSRLLALIDGCEVGDCMATCMRGLSDIQAALPAIQAVARFTSCCRRPKGSVSACVEMERTTSAMSPEGVSISCGLHRRRSTRTFSLQ